MSRWELATWVAVVVLVPGALAVFAWFLSDLRRVYRRLARERDAAQPER